MMTVSITNTLGRLQVFVLTHQEYCESHGQCCCELRDARSGVRIPSSLTLPSSTTLDGLPEAVLGVRDIRAAHRRGAISIKRSVASLPGAPAAPAPTQKSNLSPKKGKRGG